MVGREQIWLTSTFYEEDFSGAGDIYDLFGNLVIA